MLKKLFIKTFGCQMNVYDSSKMAALLNATHALELTENAEDADVLLLNTCSIREKAQEKVFSDLGRWRELKLKKPHIVIGVGGCVASQEGDAILKRAPYVDLIFGPQTLHRLPNMLKQLQRDQRSVVDISFPEIEKFDNLPAPRAEGVSALVSIIEGCSKYCSFCVVPYTRGEEVSRPLDDVLAEIMTLAQQGVREITLLGQNVNAYRGTMHDGSIADFASLIEHIAAIEGILRIRYMTSHPVEFSERLIALYETIPQLVDHLHLPVQSGSDKILSLMKRGHTILEYKNKLKKLRALRPHISFTSDFIIAFPGETDADFQATLELINEIKFDNSFSFLYSPRPGTPAAQLPDTLTDEIKKNRLEQIQAVIHANTQIISEAMIGSTQQVLVEGPSKRADGQLQGRTENNRVVNFSGPDKLIGQIVPILITESLRYSLRGRLTETISSSNHTGVIYAY